MTIVRVFGETYVNPANVGKTTFEVSFPGETRKNITTLFDLNGGVIASFETVVTASFYTDDDKPIKRDNFNHEEIIAAIKEGRDARKYE